ncbi:MAG: stage II sporulation protein M [Microthrixaceae bacterium]
MDVDRYIAAHRDTWTRLDALVARAQGSPGRLSLEETEELLRLYQLSSAHLSHVRTHHRDRALIGGLSSRVAAARQVIYGRRGRAQRAIAEFFTESFPLAVVRSWKALVVSSLLFFGPALASGIWFVNSPEELNAMMSPEEQQVLATQDFESYYSENPSGVFAALVQTNNIRVGFLALAGGATAGIVTANVLVANGINVGVVGAAMHTNGAAGTFWGLILPHGLLEIAAIVVAGAVGLKVGWAIWAPGERRTRGDAAVEEARHGVTVTLGLVLWFIVAGFIEALVTPSGLPTALKIAIGALALGAAITHVVVFGPPALARARAAGEADPWALERADLDRADAATGTAVVAGGVPGAYSAPRDFSPR